MESYNPNPLKRNALGPEDTNQSKHVKLSNESDQSIQLSTPTYDPDPAISFNDEQTRAWAKQLLGIQEDRNAIENIDSQNNNDLLSIDPEVLSLLHLDDEILPLSSNNEHHSKSLDEMDVMQYIKGSLNTECAILFRKDLMAVIKEFKKNNDEVSARKYRELLRQASQYDRDDIVWFCGEKIGFKATEEEIKKHYKPNGKLLGKFIGFCANYKAFRREIIQSIPVKKADQTNEPKDRSINYVTRPVNDTIKAQKNRRDLSSDEMDDMQYIKGLHVNSEGAKLFRTDLIAVIKEFAKNNDTVNASKYRELLRQASEYEHNDIVWFTGEKIGFKATEKEIDEIETSKKSHGKLLGKFNGFCSNYKTLRRQTVQSIPVTVKKSNPTHEPISESADRGAIQWVFFRGGKSPIRTTQTIENQDANSLLPQMNQRRA